MVNYFNSGQSFVESNYGEEHFVENLGRKKAILFVSISSAVGMQTSIS